MHYADSKVHCNRRHKNKPFPYALSPDLYFYCTLQKVECLGRGFHIGSLQFVIGLPFSYANSHCYLRNLGINSYPSDFCEQQMLYCAVINIVFAFSVASKLDDLRKDK